MLLPIWLQKTLGAFLTYGGGGVRLAHGGNATVLGWLVQRQVTGNVAIGAEIYGTIPFDGGDAQTQLNLGAIIDFSKTQHLLLSAGPSFGTDQRAQTYLAWLVTV